MASAAVILIARFIFDSPLIPGTYWFPPIRLPFMIQSISNSKQVMGREAVGASLLREVEEAPMQGAAG
jgi:hypothetical protein